MTVAVVVQGGVGAAVEPQEGAIRPFCRARRIPVAQGAAQTTRAPARQQAHNVDLVRGLAEDGPAAGLGGKLLGPPGPIEVIGVIQRMNHLHRAVFAGFDQAARFKIGGVEAMAMPYHEMHPRGAAGVDHRVAFAEA